MTARSLKQIGLSSKRSEQPSALLRDNLPGQKNPFSTRYQQALRQLQQIYALERRCFL
jgi:hypothetical protein